MSDRQVRMKAMYSEMQAEIHGPDYLVLAASAAAAKSKKKAAADAASKAAANAAFPEPAAATAQNPTTGFEQSAGCDAAGNLLEIHDGKVYEDSRMELLKSQRGAFSDEHSQDE